MKKNYLVTGGAGFIGSNYVSRLIHKGHSVTVFDNLSRAGGTLNLAWLRDVHGEDSFTMIEGDVRDAHLLKSSIQEIDVVVHLAGQVAVTTSVTDPREDFEINAAGTFNVLEAARASEKKPIVLYASTNKVYGGMEDVAISELDTRYFYRDYPEGIDENHVLDFHSPYGCSKGAGDQYVRDYARIYDIPTVVFRQSCIYGPRQFGIEDQGWLAWFVIAAVKGKPITIYGDGKQVRDVLHVEDLLDAYDIAVERIDQVAGKIFNIGGGAARTISIWKEFAPILEGFIGREIPVSWSDWRPGDQPVYVSNIKKAEQELGWSPRISVKDGVKWLIQWVEDNLDLFENF